MQSIRSNSAKAWLLAARPKTLTGAATPVLIGSALAMSDGAFQWLPALLCLIFAFLMQLVANLTNDLFDFLKGADRADRLGPQRACAQGWITPQAMKRGVLLSSLLATLTGLSLLFYGGAWLIGIGACCLLFAFLYTAGPYPLAYHGWGDLLVLLFFGFVPVGCTYYLLTGGYTPLVAGASLSCGLVIDTLLMVNNYRDEEQDRASGKRTLVVKLGHQAGSRLYLLLGVGACGVSFLFLQTESLVAALLPLLYLPLHLLTWRKMVEIQHGRALNEILGATSRNIFLFGILLALGILLA